MSGRQAKILSKDNCDDLLVFASTTRHPLRNRLIVLLSIKAGLRAAEIANLTWEMVLTPTADIGPAIELHDRAAKKSGGRLIPIHPELREALSDLRRQTEAAGPVIRSQRGGPMTPGQHRQLVRQRLSGNRLARLLIAFWPPHLHHPGRPAGPQCRCLVARRAAPGWPPINPDHPAVHRR